MTLQEVNEALTLVHDAADEEAEIIFGSLIDDSVTDEVKITIIATGFMNREARRPGQAPAHLVTRSTAPSPGGDCPPDPPPGGDSRASGRWHRAGPSKEPSLPVDEDQFRHPRPSSAGREQGDLWRRLGGGRFPSARPGWRRRRSRCRAAEAVVQQRRVGEESPGIRAALLVGHADLRSPEVVGVRSGRSRTIGG